MDVEIWKCLATGMADSADHLKDFGKIQGIKAIVLGELMAFDTSRRIF